MDPTRGNLWKDTTAVAVSGAVAERFRAAVLKTAVCKKHRGFESFLLRLLFERIEMSTSQEWSDAINKMGEERREKDEITRKALLDISHTIIEVEGQQLGIWTTRNSIVTYGFHPNGKLDLHSQRVYPFEFVKKLYEIIEKAWSEKQDG